MTPRRLPPTKMMATTVREAASDTRLHVAETTVEKLLDYCFNTPADALRSRDCVVQRCELIDRNLALLAEEGL